jgi:hypothetical protein
MKTRINKLVATIIAIIQGFWFWASGQHAAMRSKRIAVCSMCDMKSDLGTCKMCGCVLKAKASVKTQTCPHPDGDKWKGL